MVIRLCQKLCIKCGATDPATKLGQKRTEPLAHNTSPMKIKLNGTSLQCIDNEDQIEVKNLSHNKEPLRRGMFL